MQPDAVARYRTRLQQKRAELLDLEDTRHAAGDTVELDQTRQGRLSRMDALQGQAMARAHAARVQQTLRRIEAALRRCDEGTYGDCLNCDEPIGAGRLNLDPSTAFCIACAEARER